MFLLMKFFKHAYILAGIAMLAAGVAGCKQLDNDRIPPAPVYIPFQSEDLWRLYGTPASPTFRYFIKSERQPSGYPYSALSETGYGGVLLVADIHNQPCAFDLSCPVEARRDVRIVVDTEKADAYCPRCHSRYSIYSNGGIPTSGPALDDSYGLQRYAVTYGQNGEYITVTR